MGETNHTTVQLYDLWKNFVLRVDRNEWIYNNIYYISLMLLGRAFHGEGAISLKARWNIKNQQSMWHLTCDNPDSCRHKAIEGIMSHHLRTAYHVVTCRAEPPMCLILEHCNIYAEWSYKAEWSCGTMFDNHINLAFHDLGAWVRPQLGAVLHFLVWRGCQTEHLVRWRRMISCLTHVPSAMHITNVKSDGSWKWKKSKGSPYTIHKLYHDRLTNKLQTPDRVGSAVLAAAHLSQER